MKRVKLQIKSDWHINKTVTKCRLTPSTLVKLQYASAANPKMFSLIHNLTINLTSAMMHPELD